MAGWGVGIGSFATGLSSGYSLGEGIVNGAQTKKLRDLQIRGSSCF